MKMNNSFYDREELVAIGFREIGKNVLISRNSSFYSPELIRIGNNVRIDDFCVLSGNIVLHDYIHIAAYCALYGGQFGIEMKDFSGLSSRCAVYAASDDYSGHAMTNPMVPEKYRNVIGGKVIFEKHSVVGSGSTVLPNLIVGEGASIGSMALITRNIEPWSINVGIPCRKIRDREKRALELEDQFWKEIKNAFEG